MNFKKVIIFFIFIFSSFVDATMVKVVTEDLPPLQIVKGEKIVSGAAFEIVDEIFKHTEIKPNYQVLSWSRAYNTVINEPNTFIFSMLRTEKREDDFIWIGKIFSFKSNLTVLKSRKDLKSVTKDQIVNYSVGAYVADYAEDYLKSKGFVEKENLYLTEHQTALWKMLFNGRLDAIFTNNVDSIFSIIQAGFDPKDTVKLFDFDDIHTDLYLATNTETDPDIIKQVAAGFAMIKANGKFDEIVNKWEKKLSLKNND